MTLNTADTYPKVSVVMTTYNRAGYILESVESVRNQNYPNWELLIVDDGSTDETEALIARLNDPRIRFHKAGKIGLGIRLKHIGIEQTDGAFIAFIDSDDLWAPDKLNKQVAAMQDFPAAAFSITGGFNFHTKGEPVAYFYPERGGVYFGNIFRLFFLSKASVFPQTLLMRRKCLPVIEQCVQSSPGSDVDFLLELALQHPALILYEPLLQRRLHETSFSNSNWERGYEEGVEVILRYRKKRALVPELAREALFRLYLRYGQSCHARKRKGKALEKFWLAWLNKPLSIVPLKKSLRLILG